MLNLPELSNVWYEIRGNPASLGGFITVIIFVAVALLAPWIAPYPKEGWGLTYNSEKRFLPPSLEHPFGTDELGRDVLSRVILGARTSLLIAFSVVLFSMIIGGFIGIIAGYLGGNLGTFIMRIVDMFLAFPPLLLALAIAATIGRGFVNAIVALTISWWPWYSRLAYVQTLSIKNLPYIEAAKTIGVSGFWIMIRHILPNTLPPMIIQASMDLGSAILEAAGLSFLGLGVQPPAPDWGLMVSVGRIYIRRAWWISFFPGMAIFLTVLGFNLMGDALREGMDPRLRRV